MTLTIGQLLTPEQAAWLPDGAVCRVTGDFNGFVDIQVTSPMDFSRDIRFGTWHSAVLVSLPSTAPSKPEDNNNATSEKLSQNGSDAANTYTYGCTGAPVKESLTTQTTTRQAREIEKEAAKLYEQSTANSVESWLDKFGSCDTLFTWHDELNLRMAEYRRVYDYARSIGAID